MKYTVSFKTILGRRSLFSLAAVVVLSIACQNSNSINHSAPHPGNAQGTPAPSNSQLGAAAPGTNLSVDRTEAKNATKPSIEITEVPSKGAGEQVLETIAGKVSGVRITDCKVVVFARTNTWYVQPYIGASDTAINEDNTWRTDTHLGSKYAAVLVKNSYKPPSTTGKLPDVGGSVLAIATADAKQ